MHRLNVTFTFSLFYLELHMSLQGRQPEAISSRLVILSEAKNLSHQVRDSSVTTSVPSE